MSERSPLAEIGLIGGSGFYQFFQGKVKEVAVKTKFGYPSDKITIGQVAGKRVAFLPRHGKHHHLPPHKIPYLANLAALKSLGARQIIAPAAVGSLKAKIKPGDFVFCDQFIDRTKNRADTFFNGPKVAHLETAYAYCPILRQVGIVQAKRLNLRAHAQGTVVVIEGPRFSTLAESLWFSKMGWDTVNMTQYPEVALAGELGLCYLNISLVTDYDTGIYAKTKVKPVSIDQVLGNFRQNIDKLKGLIAAIIKNLPKEQACDCLAKAERAKI